jgi:hypothetical protein
MSHAYGLGQQVSARSDILSPGNSPIEQSVAALVTRLDLLLSVSISIVKQVGRAAARWCENGR